mgnify:CR=1 FL=1
MQYDHQWAIIVSIIMIVCASSIQPLNKDFGSKFNLFLAFLSIGVDFENNKKYKKYDEDRTDTLLIRIWAPN